VNSGLMTFFFFIFGLEACREFDMGELLRRLVKCTVTPVSHAAAGGRREAIAPLFNDALVARHGTTPAI